MTWWFVVSATAWFIAGVCFVAFPSRVRTLLFPRWREQMERWPIHGLDLWTLRVTGLGFVIMSTIVVLVISKQGEVVP